MSLLGLLVIGAWVVLVTAVFNIVLEQRLDRQAHVVLHTRAITAAATVEVAPGRVTVRDTSGDAELDSGLWIYAGGRAIDRPSGGRRFDPQTRELAAGAAGYHQRGDDIYYVLPVRRESRRVATVVALQSDLAYAHAQTEALVGSSIVALLVLLGAYPVLRFAAGRALRPVRAMTEQAGEWSAQGLDERFGTEQRYEEIQALAGTLDGVLDRLSAIVRHERQLSAELSHELRTPLSRIVAETDLLLGRPHAADELASAHSAVRDSAMAMESILETLLSAARVDIQIAPGRSDVATLLDTVTGARHRDDGVRVVARGGAGLALGVEAAVAERILAPILDNAARYARSVVEVTAVRSSGSIALDVRDDGPGVPHDLQDVIFEPGRRGQPDDGHDGVGLGLALARRLARAASGDVTVLDDPRGGACFRVRLPSA